MLTPAQLRHALGKFLLLRLVCWADLIFFTVWALFCFLTPAENKTAVVTGKYHFKSPLLIIAGAVRFDKEMIPIGSAYPALNRAAFLIERTCVPRYYPTFCAETAQLLALLDEASRRQATQSTNEVNKLEH